MMMKDKLERHNHKKSYFFFKKVLGISSCIFGSIVLLAIPVSIVSSIVDDTEITQKSSNETNEFIENINSFENELLKF